VDSFKINIFFLEIISGKYYCVICVGARGIITQRRNLLHNA